MEKFKKKLLDFLLSANCVHFRLVTCIINRHVHKPVTSLHFRRLTRSPAPVGKGLAGEAGPGRACFHARRLGTEISHGPREAAFWHASSEGVDGKRPLVTEAWPEVNRPVPTLYLPYSRGVRPWEGREEASEPDLLHPHGGETGSDLNQLERGL